MHKRKRKNQDKVTMQGPKWQSSQTPPKALPFPDSQLDCYQNVTHSAKQADLKYNKH